MLVAGILGETSSQATKPMDLQSLTAYCDTLLEADRFDDYCPNGLQVEAGTSAHKLVTGVTASQALIDAAIEQEADVVLVHHGFFWKNEHPSLRGMKGRRIGALFRHGVSLLAYHLPLDCHPELGNNVQLAAILGFPAPTPMDGNKGLIWQAELPTPVAPTTLARNVAERLGRTPLLIGGGDHPIRRVAWCTGGAQGYIEQAAMAGADAYLSGEISEPTTHAARELGIHYFAAGHHATERYGVKALGEHLAARFGIDHRHIDIDNPA